MCRDKLTLSVKLEVLSNVYECHVQARIIRVKSFLPQELETRE